MQLYTMSINDFCGQGFCGANMFIGYIIIIITIINCSSVQKSRVRQEGGTRPFYGYCMNRIFYIYCANGALME